MIWYCIMHGNFRVFCFQWFVWVTILQYFVESCPIYLPSTSVCGHIIFVCLVYLCWLHRQMDRLFDSSFYSHHVCIILQSMTKVCWGTCLQHLRHSFIVRVRVRVMIWLKLKLHLVYEFISSKFLTGSNQYKVPKAWYFSYI